MLRRPVESALAAAIGMMQQSIRFAPSPDCHHQGIGNELRCHRSPHRPADNAPGEEIDNSSHIEPTLRCPHIREVSNPFAIGSRGVEGAVEHVRSDGGRLPLTQVGRQAPPARTCFEGLQPHQPLNPMQTARQPFRKQVFPHPSGAVGPVARNEAGADLCAKLFIASATLTAWSCQPGIKPASRDTERLAQPTRRPDPPVLRNETELHVDSFAK